MINALLPLVLACLCTVATAQVPSILWQQVHGGSGADIAQQVLATPDGGWIMVGITASTDGDVTGNHGGRDGWLVKLNATGAITWQRAYGGTADDGLTSICPAGDGGYLLCGSSASANGDLTENNGQNDAWLMKVTATGTIVWQVVLGGALNDGFSRVIPTADGNFLCVGSSHTNLGGDPIPHFGGFDGMVVKVSPTGTILWQRILGGNGDDEFFRVQATSDGGYIVGGQSTTTSVSGVITEPANSTSTDVWVVKLNGSGNITWQRMIGGTAVEQTFDLLVTSDQEYLVVGHASSADGDIPVGQGIHDALLIKLTATGTVEWLKTLGSSQMDAANAVIQMEDGGFLFYGSARANDGDVSGFNGFVDAWLVRTDALGELVWQECLGGSGSDNGRAIQRTADGGLLLVASANSSNGDVAESLGAGDMWLVRMGSLAVGVAEQDLAPFTLGPNPTSGPLHVFFEQASEQAVVRVTDLNGREVRRASAMGANLTLDLTGEPAGAYLVEVVRAGLRRTLPVLLTPMD